MVFASVSIPVSLWLRSRSLFAADCLCSFLHSLDSSECTDGDPSVWDYYRCRRKMLMLPLLCYTDSTTSRVCACVAHVVEKITRKQRHSRLILKKKKTIFFSFLFCDLFIAFWLSTATAAACIHGTCLGHKWKFIYFSLSSHARVNEWSEWTSATEWASDACNIRNCLSIDRRSADTDVRPTLGQHTN